MGCGRDHAHLGIHASQAKTAHHFKLIWLVPPQFRVFRLDGSSTDTGVSVEAVQRHYMESGGFLTDLVGCIPLDYLVMGALSLAVRWDRWALTRLADRSPM